MPLIKLNLIANSWFPGSTSFASADPADFCEPESIINVSVYTVLSAVILCSLFMLFIVVITSFKSVISKISMWTVILPMIILCFRMLFPVEFTNISFVINSAHIVPYLDSIMFYEPIKTSFISLTVLNILCIIWAFIAVILLLRYIVRYRKFFRMTEKIPQTNNEVLLNAMKRVKDENNFKFKSKIIENNLFDFPFEYGLFSQSVFINKGDYTEDELYYIFSHELAHFKNRSNYIKVFADLLSIIFWWNPVMYILKNHIENLLEIFVDRNVTKNLDIKEKAAYMKCIYKVFVNIKTTESKDSAFGIPMAKPKESNLLFNRFKVIAKTGKINKPVSIAMLLLTMFFAFVSSVYLLQPCYEPPADDLAPVTFDEEGLNSEDTYIIEENGSYILYYKGERLLSNPDKSVLPDVPLKKK
ncbi:MAG: M56 family metallopeptidase [Eubacterium sp.]|nr:M56 family metallopeptidase [Eubacterium sp.]